MGRAVSLARTTSRMAQAPLGATVAHRLKAAAVAQAVRLEPRVAVAELAVRQTAVKVPLEAVAELPAEDRAGAGPPVRMLAMVVAAAAAAASLTTISSSTPLLVLL